MQGLTKRQKEILDFIRTEVAEKGFPPTRNEIARHFGFRSPNAARDHLSALETKEYITIQPGLSRGIQLVGEDLPGFHGQRGRTETLPLVGRVAAGEPILATENIEDQCEVDPNLFKPRADYLLRVHGMSMRDVGILDGDLLAVHRTPEARNGQIVVARIDDEVTVKRFQRSDSDPANNIRLIAENIDFEDIIVDLSTTEITIEGWGVGVIRNHI